MTTADEITLCYEYTLKKFKPIQDRFDSHLTDVYIKLFKLVSNDHGWCWKCVYGNPDCLSCGGVGVSREILRQT